MQVRFGSGAHVQRLAGQPHRFHPDHRSNSRVQAAKSAAALQGQMMVIVTGPRRSSTRMSADAGAVSTGCHQRQRDELTCLGRYRFALAGQLSPAVHDVGIDAMPCAIATFATEAPGSLHAATCAIIPALYRRLVSVFSLVIVST